MSKIFWAFERRLLKRSRFFKSSDVDLSGQTPVAIITGGSEGIGLALARACAELGLDLLLIARDQGKLDAAVKVLAESYDVKVLTLSVDLAEAVSSVRVQDFLKEQSLVPHLLINNAGIGLCGPFLRHGPEQIQHMLDLNMSSGTALIRLLLPGMLKRRMGGIINVSSLAGMVPGPYQAAYYASKAYMNSLSEALSQELAFSGVRVSAVAPGPVATNFHARMGAERSVYLFVQNVLSAEHVARSSIIWFALGRCMIVPGFLNFLNSLFIRIIPHSILVPIMGLLLKRRGEANGKPQKG